MDFQQGLITTVHDYGLGNLDPAGFQRQLERRPTALLIPCLMEEFSRPALKLIREALSELRGLQSLVVALAADTAEDVAAAERGLLSEAAQIIWLTAYFAGITDGEGEIELPEFVVG